MELHVIFSRWLKKIEYSVKVMMHLEERYDGFYFNAYPTLAEAISVRDAVIQLKILNDTILWDKATFEEELSKICPCFECAGKYKYIKLNGRHYAVHLPVKINGKKTIVCFNGRFKSRDEAIPLRDKIVEVIATKEEWDSKDELFAACGFEKIGLGGMTVGERKKKVAENNSFWKDALEREGGDNKKIRTLAGNTQFKMKDSFKKGYYDNKKLKSDDRYKGKGLVHPPPAIQTEVEPQCGAIAMV